MVLTLKGKKQPSRRENPFPAPQLANPTHQQARRRENHTSTKIVESEPTCLLSTIAAGSSESTGNYKKQYMWYPILIQHYIDTSEERVINIDILESDPEQPTYLCSHCDKNVQLECNCPSFFFDVF